MSLLDGLRHRLHVWLHADEYAREQADERRFHREMEALGGHGNESAHAGDWRPRPSDRGPRRDVRRLPAQLVGALRQDVAYAARGLLRAPGFTLLAVLTLALGVGANAAVFSLLDRLFGQTPAGVREPDRLRRLYVRLPEHPLEPGMVFHSFSYPALSAVDDAVSGAGEVAAWTPSAEAAFREGGREVTARASWVTHDYFAVVGVGAARGRVFGPDEARIEVPAPVAVISHAFWERAFGGDPGVVGRTIALDSASFTVIGVAVEGFSGLDLSYTDVFLPASTFPAQGQLGLPWYRWIGNYFRAVARLLPGVDERELAARGTAGYHRQVLPDRGAAPLDSTATVLVGSIIEARGPGRHAGTPHQRQALSVSMRVAGVSVILLLIASANLACLLLVRATRRRREIAVRLALGISRRRLVVQLLAEGAVLACLGAGAAILLAAWGGHVLRSLLLPEVYWARKVLDVRTTAFGVATAAAAGILAALAPALQALRVDVAAGIGAGSTGGGSQWRSLRSALLVSQAALSTVLLAGAVLFVRSLGNVSALRLGFDVQELVWINPGRAIGGEEEPGLRARMASRLVGLPGVVDAALAAHPPMHGVSMLSIFLPGRDSLPAFRPDAYPAFNLVSPGFFTVTGMRILRGRGFAPGDEGVLVVSETMARTLWPGEDALGKCIILRERDAPCAEVIGVVEDSRRMQLLEAPTLHYFLPRAEHTAGGVILLRVVPRHWNEVARAVHAELSGHFEERSMRVRRMTESLEPQLRPWRLGAQLFSAFGLLATLVTIVGVYSVMSYAMSQRTREVGVRVALGARLRHIVRLALSESVSLMGLGILLGVAVALALGRLVESLLYGVTPRDPSALAAAGLVLVVTGVVASLVPAWRAARVHPSEVLRQE